MDRWIIHSDINHCYAQIEEMKSPELRKIPMAVGGHEEDRHGIILAKNDLAKEFHIKTGESLREAYRKCPQLLVIPPHYEDYLYYTEEVKNIYCQYSPEVESFGLDEAWIDITGTERLFRKSPIELAKEIQLRVYEELGLTVSMGLSFNKIFAKLGSDMDKKMGFTVITKENYQDLVFPLPVEDLLYVGRATKAKLNACHIKTIGDLAYAPREFLKLLLGKNGEMIWCFANGYDSLEVNPNEPEAKSVGNGITTKHDVQNMKEARIVLTVLSESVAARLKKMNKMGNVISVGFRYNDLTGIMRQMKIKQPTNLAKEILETAMILLYCNWTMEVPLRSLTISVSSLIKETEYNYQVNLFNNQNEDERRKLHSLECAIQYIREKWGEGSIRYCNTLLDTQLSDFSTQLGINIHPPEFRR